MSEQAIMAWVLLIKNGHKTLDDVPQEIKEQVEQQLGGVLEDGQE